MVLLAVAIGIYCKKKSNKARRYSLDAAARLGEERAQDGVANEAKREPLAQPSPSGTARPQFTEDVNPRVPNKSTEKPTPAEYNLTPTEESAPQASEEATMETDLSEINPTSETDHLELPEAWQAALKHGNVSARLHILACNTLPCILMCLGLCN